LSSRSGDIESTAAFYEQSMSALADKIGAFGLTDAQLDVYVFECTGQRSKWAILYASAFSDAVKKIAKSRPGESITEGAVPEREGKAVERALGKWELWCRREAVAKYEQFRRRRRGQ
jgi:hypothetical protein